MNDLAQLLAICGLFGVIFAFLVNLAFGLGLFVDALGRRRRGQRVRFVPSFVWLLGTLVGSFLVVALYWLVHDSTLVAHQPEVDS